MSRYPWGNGENANPYTNQNNHKQVGVQGLNIEFEDSNYPRRPTEEQSDRIVSSVQGLVDALESGSDEFIWIEPNLYNLTEEDRRIDISEGTTLASDGAVLYCDEPKNGLFNITNDNVRLTGIRFQGPQIGYVEDYETTRGIMVRGNIEIDNCEIYGWPSSGIYVGYGGEGTTPPETIKPHIHHNVIRDNQESSLGYGIVTYNGDPLIEYNFINGNRHGIAGSGGGYSSYRLYNNVHGEDGLIFQAEQHHPGGVTMDIKNNEFRMTETDNGNPARAYAQRGTPQDVATINDNWIFNPNEPGAQPDGDSDAAIIQESHDSNDWVNVEFNNNHYGSSEPTDSTIGVQPLDGGIAFDGFNGTTNQQGMVEVQVPDSDYRIIVNHERYDGSVEDTVTISGQDEEVTISFGG